MYVIFDDMPFLLLVIVIVNLLLLLQLKSVASNSQVSLIFCSHLFQSSGVQIVIHI